MENIHWQLVAPLVVLQVILTIAALVSCVRQEHTRGPKWMWILIILFMNTIGPIIYFIFGRKSE
ncbi:PLD nuclease N-terminal domain-containing protein [Bacillus sp. 165]|uniref:PLD nuclease N-terminal domain-containing protein n=1 Tax=Bacillus sp. 165 TaxID=1529117 RepID=UPI001ADD242D|nr:PLD nuclease N-terminal domain-containing protein [Bacillus sp. 165]MBO9129163.1 PLDc_N domain-containing protein [Bacillus sp. 165]